MRAFEGPDLRGVGSVACRSGRLNIGLAPPPPADSRTPEIPHLRPTEYKRSRLSRKHTAVNRPCGGVLSGTAVRETQKEGEPSRVP
ncbi:hypothetical protein ZWY2020_002867 [Hordeum vulgare]|nr:hypothetical protein ZWY2020_002867 [Hordeum vulgare]